MLDALNDAVLSVGDFLLGWMLHLPRDLVLILVALFTALALIGVRLFTTNQEFLRRCKADKARLKELIREAKKRGDKQAVARHRCTMQQIGMKSMAAEGKPLLAAILPVVVIAVWAFARIAYLPPQPGEDVVIKIYFPQADIGEYVHLLPQSGVEARTGSIQKVRDDVFEGRSSNGIAEWTLRCQERDEPYTLTFRHDGQAVEKVLTADGLHYANPQLAYSEDPADVIEVALPEYKPFGIISSLWIVQPWLVGYFVIVLPLSFLLKPVLRIC